MGGGGSPNSKTKGELFIPPFPLRFVRGQFSIHLLVIKMVSGMVIRGYFKDRNLCVVFEIKMAMLSAGSRIYQVPFLFIALINTDHKMVTCTRTGLKCDFIVKQIKDANILYICSRSGD